MLKLREIINKKSWHHIFQESLAIKLPINKLIAKKCSQKIKKEFIRKHRIQPI